LRAYQVAVVALAPRHHGGYRDPLNLGRAVATLAADPDVLTKPALADRPAAIEAVRV
jgi:hypothetical protein